MLLFLVSTALAGDLVVTFAGAASPAERVRCRAFSEAQADVFPGGASPHQAQATATAEGPACRFEGLAAGRWAVSALLDEDDDLELDTNLLGIPTEPWGVTRDARPRFRAPTFDEAAVEVPADGLRAEQVTLSD